MIHTLEILTHTDWPGHGRTLDFEDVFDFIEHLNGVSDFSVKLVDKRQNRRISQPTDFHQFDRTIFHTLSTIDDHQH